MNNENVPVKKSQIKEQDIETLEKLGEWHKNNGTYYRYDKILNFLQGLYEDTPHPTKEQLEGAALFHNDYLPDTKLSEESVRNIAVFVWNSKYRHLSIEEIVDGRFNALSYWWRKNVEGVKEGVSN